MAVKGSRHLLSASTHSGDGCGSDSIFVMEYVASHGYISVAADYAHTKPSITGNKSPFCRLRGGNLGKPWRLMRLVRRFAGDISGNRDLLLADVGASPDVLLPEGSSGSDIGKTGR